MTAFIVGRSKEISEEAIRVFYECEGLQFLNALPYNFLIAKDREYEEMCRCLSFVKSVGYVVSQNCVDDVKRDSKYTSLIFAFVTFDYIELQDLDAKQLLMFRVMEKKFTLKTAWLVSKERKEEILFVLFCCHVMEKRIQK